MIAKLIDVCMRNRAMVLCLGVCLIAVGAWSTGRIAIDAIPDLSDVQVILRTDMAGQAPQIIEDQVTYPLTTAMLAVPQAKIVRGYSLFGTSFVYVIFKEGTDLYWARSRVLEQLSTVTNQLPPGVSPQLGPDATGVGWIYQYILTTGRYCPNHPQGLWHNPVTDIWYSLGNVPADTSGLVFHRVFGDDRTVYVAADGQSFDRLADAPAKVRSALTPVVVEGGLAHCPLDDQLLMNSDQDLANLRSLQDWYLRFELTAVQGVSEVASLGGFVKQYQVVVDPVKLLAYNIPLGKVRQVIERSNRDVGGRLLEMSETEYMVRSLGYLGQLSERELQSASQTGQSLDALRTARVLEQLGQASLGATVQGTPISLSDVASIQVGPEIRRGLAEWNGQGEVVAGIVVMRFGENARATIDRVRTRLTQLEQGLPPGVAIEVAYDRSDLIDRAIKTVSMTLVEEIVVVSLVMLLFLMHARSVFVAVVVLPMSVLATLTFMHLLGINANIMSLGGIAISIGVMVDSSVVMVENAHKHMEREKERVAKFPDRPLRSRVEVIADAAKEVGPTLFFSLLIITVSFLPIFVLHEQSGRMFKPLAYTKTLAMAWAAILAVTIIPVLMSYFVSERILPEYLSKIKQRLIYGAIVLLPALLLLFVPLSSLTPWRWGLAVGWLVLSAILILPQKIIPEQRNPLNQMIQWMYDPFFNFVMRFRAFSLGVAFLVLVTTWWPLGQLGSEFMPPLEEGDLLYMPTTDPGISVTKARELLQQTDKIIASYPEVQSVFGKIGRAQTATDPAPMSMVETTIVLYRDKSRWRQVPVKGSWFGRSRPITINELVYGYDLPASEGRSVHVKGLHDGVQMPGLTNAWTMPIKTRIDMLSTGIKTPVGIKVMGPDLATLARLSSEIAQALKTDPVTRDDTVSAFAEKAVGGNYFDIDTDRQAIARYGLTVGDVQDVIMSALGGANVSTTIEGLQRYPINLRYPRELRDNLASLRQTLVPTPSGAQIPLGHLASFEIHKGPPMIKSENARLTSWVFVEMAGLDVGTYVQHAQEVVNRNVTLPPGYTLVWSGQYEYMQSARERLLIVVPLAGVLIVLLLYGATQSWVRVGILVLSLPFSMVGAVWLLYAMDYNLSLAVWVGLIALAGLSAETGLVMLLYLDNSFERFVAQGKMRNPEDLWQAIHEGAVQRIRPKTMTVVTTFVGLMPLLWASGAGADTMRRLAVPLIGGLATAFILVLLIYPVVFYGVKRIALRRAWH